MRALVDATARTTMRSMSCEPISPSKPEVVAAATPVPAVAAPPASTPRGVGATARARLHLMGLGLGLIWLGGCATGSDPSSGSADGRTGPSSSGGTGAPGGTVAPRKRTLASEQRRLSSLLRDTPVGIDSTPEGSVRVVVPLEFCFDRRRAAVQPALGAVLNHIAIGARDSPGFALQVMAPSDASGVGGATLAQERAAAVRDYLVGRGVPRPRIVQIGRTADPQVQVLMSERLD